MPCRGAPPGPQIGSTPDATSEAERARGSNREVTAGCLALRAGATASSHAVSEPPGHVANKAARDETGEAFGVSGQTVEGSAA